MYNINTIGTGMLVKSESGQILATANLKMDNNINGGGGGVGGGGGGGGGGVHTTSSGGGGGGGNHQSTAVALVGQQQQQGQQQLVNGSSEVAQNGSGRSSPSGDPAPNKLFVGGLSWQTTQDRLREYFNGYGEVKDVLIMKDPISQRSRGFGFITFGDPASVEKVIAIPNHTLDGKKIDPKHATPKNRVRSNKIKKIFVGGVSQETSNEEVKAYFSHMGKVEEAVMLMDNQTKRHRGFGFVTFEDAEVVDRVCEVRYHTIKNKKVECKPAQPKEAVAAASMFPRKLMNPLGMTLPGMAAGMGGMITNQQAANFAAAQALAINTYGKVVSNTYPTISYRYTPYPLPPTAATGATHQSSVVAAAAASHLQQQQQQHSAAAAAAASHHHHHQAATGHHHHHPGHQQHAIATVPPPPSTPQASAYSATGHPHHHHHAALTAASAAGAAAAAAGGSHHSMVSTVPHSQAQVFTSPATLAGAAPPPHTFAAGSAHTGLAASPYQGYALPNVDMTGFQNIDWNTQNLQNLYPLYT